MLRRSEGTRPRTGAAMLDQKRAVAHEKGLCGRIQRGGRSVGARGDDLNEPLNELSGETEWGLLRDGRDDDPPDGTGRHHGATRTR